MPLILIICSFILLLGSMLFGIFNPNSSVEKETDDVFKDHSFVMTSAFVGLAGSFIGAIWWILKFIQQNPI